MRRVELVIERLSKSGDGVAREGGRSVFVPRALPGERIVAELDDGKKTLRAELKEVLTPSPARRTPLCPLADRCGGCDWMHVEESTQVLEKERIVVSALEHLGGLSPDRYRCRPTVRSTAAVGYRRRCTLHPAQGGLGFFGQKSHDRVRVDHCPALTAPLAGMPGALALILGAMLKDVEEVRLLECEGRVAVSVHLKAAWKPRHVEVLTSLVREGRVDGVVLLPGEGKGAVVVLGDPVLEEGGVRYRPDGFAQANADVNRQLVREAVDLLDLTQRPTVLELYAGNGNFTFEILAQASSVVAVESAAISVRLAQEAARARRLEGLRLVQGDCERIAEGLVREGARFDRLLLDPPRTGAPGVGRWASRLLVSRLVYVACDPAALARDAAALVQEGFAPLVLELFDVFPQTRHIEAVMAFGR